MKPETLDYLREAGPFRAEIASIPCLILAANEDIIAECEDQDVAEHIADALNSIVRASVVRPSVKERRTSSKMPKARFKGSRTPSPEPGGQPKPKGKSK